MKRRHLFFLLFVMCIVAFSVITESKDSLSRSNAAFQTVETIELPESGQNWNLQTGPKDLLKGRELVEDQMETLGYLLFMPQNEEQKTADGYPLILFLHGMGERGDNPLKVAHVGLPNLLNKPQVAQTFPFIVVSPQCPDGKCWSAKQLSVFLDKILEKYPVDRSRVYVTGLSMGGFGSWSLMAERPDAFAAGAPICGGSDLENAGKLIDLPIWAFHGDIDPIVPPALTKNMVEAVRKAGGEKIRQTIFFQVSHNAWDYVYCNPDLYDWLLSHKREKP